MTREEYLAQRVKMLEEAKASLKAGDVEAAKNKRAEIEKLDADYEAMAKEQANIDALKDQVIPGAIIDGIAGQKSGRDPEGVQAEMKPGEIYTKVFSGKTLNTAESAAHKTFESAYAAAFGAWLKGEILDKEHSEIFDTVNSVFRAATNTTETAGSLVPTVMRDGIWSLMESAHPIINDINKTAVAGNLTIMKAELNGDADWYDEDTATADSEVDAGTIELFGCELSKGVPVSYKLKKMAAADFMSWLTRKLAEKMGSALANGILNGKGKPGTNDTWKAQPKGIVTSVLAEENTPQVVTYSAADPMTYKKITALFAAVSAPYLAGARIYAASTTIWNELANIVDDVKRPIFIADTTAGGVGRLLGKVVIPEDHVPVDAVLLGNVKEGTAYNVVEDVTIGSQDDLKNRKTFYAANMIIDGEVMTTKAFAYLKKTV